MFKNGLGILADAAPVHAVALPIMILVYAILGASVTVIFVAIVCYLVGALSYSFGAAWLLNRKTKDL